MSKVCVYLSSAMSAPTFDQFRKNCVRASRVAHELRSLGYAFKTRMGTLYGGRRIEGRVTNKRVWRIERG
jgi:hypothetical protein